MTTQDLAKEEILQRENALCSSTDYPATFEKYKQAVASFWTVEEVTSQRMVMTGKHLQKTSFYRTCISLFRWE